MALNNVATASMVSIAILLSSRPCFSLDMKHAEIEGIHLYDSDKTVIATLKRRLGPAVKLDIHMEDRLLGEGRRIGSISVEYNKHFLGVTFSEQAPPRKGNVATNVHYLPVPIVPVSRAKRTIFRDTIIAKYGPPDLIQKSKANPRSSILTWCDDDRKLGWRPGFSPAPNEPCKGWSFMTLHHDNSTSPSPAGGLGLADPFLSDAAYRYSQKSQRGTRP